MIRNRRKFPRIALDCEAFISTQHESFTLPIANLSFTGAYFKTSNPLPLNFQLLLSWQDAKESNKTAARVIRQDSDGFAVAFASSTRAFIVETCELIWQNVKNDRIPQGLLTGTERPGNIVLFVSKGYEYEPVFTFSLNQKMVWTFASNLQSDEEAFWLTLPEHGLFDGKAKVIPTLNEQVTAIEFVKPSEEFNLAYQRILNSY